MSRVVARARANASAPCDDDVGAGGSSSGLDRDRIKKKLIGKNPAPSLTLLTHEKGITYILHTHLLNKL